MKQTTRLHVHPLSRRLIFWTILFSGGEVWATAEPERGATFRFTLG